MASRGGLPERPRLSPAGRGYQVTHVGKPLYSAGDPVASAERRAAAVRSEEQTLYIVPSPLLAYGLDTLLVRLPASSHVLAVEVDVSLAALTRERVPSSLQRSSRVTWLLAVDDATIEHTLRSFSPRQFRRVRLVSLNAGYAVNRERYRSFQRFAEQEIQRRWQNRLTEVRLGRRWVHNVIRNLQVLPESGDIADLRVGRPIAVAAAGPSLEDSIPLLREHRSKLTVIAVDTAARPLSCAGIQPDAVVSLDGQWANLQDFVGLGLDNTVCLNEIAGYPTVTRLSGEFRLLFSTDFAPLRFLRRLAHHELRPTTVAPRGSVGITATELALDFAARSDPPLPVFLVGLDLAFDPLHTHARGSTLMDWYHRVNSRLNPLPAWQLGHRRQLLTRTDKTGLPTMTTSILVSYASQLSEITAGRANLVDLRAAGLPLTLPTSTPGDLAATLRHYDSLPAIHTPTAVESRFKSNKLAGFLEDELRHLEAAEHTATRFLEHRSRAALQQQELELIRNVDYAWVHFPDELSDNPAFIARLIPAFREYRDLLSKARDAVDVKTQTGRG